MPDKHDPQSGFAVHVDPDAIEADRFAVPVDLSPGAADPPAGSHAAEPAKAAKSAKAAAEPAPRERVRRKEARAQAARQVRQYARRRS